MSEPDAVEAFEAGYLKKSARTGVTQGVGVPGWPSDDFDFRHPFHPIEAPMIRHDQPTRGPVGDRQRLSGHARSKEDPIRLEQRD